MKSIQGTEFIVKTSHGNFNIKKSINGKQKYFGAGETLIIALMKRDWCMANGWKEKYPANFSYIQRTPYGNYRIRKRIIVEGEGKDVGYGYFKSYDDAKAEVELLKKCNWDYDLAVEVDERVDGKIIFNGREM